MRQCDVRLTFLVVTDDSGPQQQLGMKASQYKMNGVEYPSQPPGMASVLPLLSRERVKSTLVSP